MTQFNFPNRSEPKYPDPQQWLALDDRDRRFDRNNPLSVLLVGIFIITVIASSIAAVYLFNLLPRSTSTAPTTTSSTSLSLPLASQLDGSNSIESTL
jgi:hypothetical protein